ncbi:undecaprenyldiphospho-muramoylpentapeptide beta-N-acetylglucosaminyltransferase [Oceanispirochaeta sp. M1]|nr:undecaprenyldiphospho-muramoylpentapeptide beta-N-acetylglucosaminyltransferase [Oceanispirochaeta sp. M1]
MTENWIRLKYRQKKGLKNNMKKTIVFTGGGTGGHVYPALPIIKKLQDQGYRILWIGSHRGIEKRIVQSWGIEYRGISTGKLRRYFSLKNFTDIFRIKLGFFQSLRILNKIKPVLIFSKGGFVSVPPLTAGYILKIPCYTHDSDVVPGLATRINHKMTRNTFLAYEESRSYLGGNSEKIVVSGNPVREEFFDKNQKLPDIWEKRIGERPLLMVLGGSSGASQINELILESLSELCSRYTIIHQMGDELFKEDNTSEHYYPVPYLNEELPALLRRADIAVARSGAGTLWELAVSATPSILIPLRAGSRGDQILNAEMLRKREMAIVIEDENPESFQIRDLLIELADNNEKLERMKDNCAGFMKKKAEDVIVSYLIKES